MVIVNADKAEKLAKLGFKLILQQFQLIYGYSSNVWSLVSENGWNLKY